LLSGDTIYDDVLVDEITGADIADYVASLQRLREPPVHVVLPGHGPASATHECGSSSTGT
jgi:glyoxylase-like metal-dependent hydrolase (beta-lactamase superfamily II)